MIKLDRLCAWVLIFSLAMLPLHNFVGFADELSYAVLLLIAFVDCIINGNWKRYRYLAIVVVIMAFYMVYSMTMVHYTTKMAIVKGFIIELKPYATFFITLAIAPRLTVSEKFIVKVLCILATIIGFIVLMMGQEWIELIMGHSAYIYQGATVCFLLYLYVSQKDGVINRDSLIIALAILLTGLPASKAKYLGFLVIALFLIFVYKPGMFSRLSLSKVVILGVLALGVVGISWNKIHYYFLQEPMDMVDLNDEESFARPALYAGSLLIFQDHIPFGTGLASYASFASIEPYSGVYAEYGLDKVWGLSESYSSFICDAFYPSLAQFGIAGVALFICFWVFVVLRLRRLLRSNPEKYNILYIIGVLIICFILIESIAATTFTNAYGQTVLMLLAMICGRGSKASIERDKLEPEKFVI